MLYGVESPFDLLGPGTFSIDVTRFIISIISIGLWTCNNVAQEHLWSTALRIEHGTSHILYNRPI